MRPGNEGRAAEEQRFPRLFWPLHYGPNTPDLGTLLGRPLCCAGCISCRTALPTPNHAGWHMASMESWTVAFMFISSSVRNKESPENT